MIKFDDLFEVVSDDTKFEITYDGAKYTATKQDFSHIRFEQYAMKEVYKLSVINDSIIVEVID